MKKIRFILGIIATVFFLKAFLIAMPYYSMDFDWSIQYVVKTLLLTVMYFAVYFVTVSHIMGMSAMDMYQKFIPPQE